MLERNHLSASVGNLHGSSFFLTFKSYRFIKWSLCRLLRDASCTTATRYAHGMYIANLKLANTNLYRAQQHSCGNETHSGRLIDLWVDGKKVRFDVIFPSSRCSALSSGFWRTRRFLGYKIERDFRVRIHVLVLLKSSLGSCSGSTSCDQTELSSTNKIRYPLGTWQLLTTDTLRWWLTYPMAKIYTPAKEFISTVKLVIVARGGLMN